MSRSQSIEVWARTNTAISCTIGRSKYENLKLKEERRRERVVLQKGYIYIYNQWSRALPNRLANGLANGSLRLRSVIRLRPQQPLAL